MKKLAILIITTTIIATIVILITSNYNYEKHMIFLIKKNESLRTKLNEVQKNIFLSLKFKDFNLDSLGINSFLLENKFIIIFPEDICNICYEKVFYSLEKLDTEKKKKITVIIPDKFKRKFSIYNSTYNLNIENIIYHTCKNQFKMPLDHEVIMLFCSNNGHTFSPVILNSQFYDINNYIENIENIENNSGYNKIK